MSRRIEASGGLVAPSRHQDEEDAPLGHQGQVQPDQAGHPARAAVPRYDMSEFFSGRYVESHIPCHVLS